MPKNSKPGEVTNKAIQLLDSYNMQAIKDTPLVECTNKVNLDALMIPTKTQLLPEGNTFKGETSTPSMEYGGSDQANCTMELKIGTPLSTTPLAIQEPVTSHDEAFLLQYHENNLEAASRIEEVQSLTTSMDPKGLGEDLNSDFQLTRSQRKKKAKMMHALMQKNKASHAKSTGPPSSTSK